MTMMMIYIRSSNTDIHAYVNTFEVYVFRRPTRSQQAAARPAARPRCGSESPPRLGEQSAVPHGSMGVRRDVLELGVVLLVPPRSRGGYRAKPRQAHHPMRPKVVFGHEPNATKLRHLVVDDEAVHEVL